MEGFVAGRALVSPRGIRFHGNYYSCHRAIKEQWFEKAVSKKWFINIKSNPLDLSKIYLLSSNDNQEIEEVCDCILVHTISGKKLERYFESIQRLQALRRRQRNRKPRYKRLGYSDMRQLISAIEHRIRVQTLNLERYKKQYDPSFTNECDALYLSLLTQKSIDVWNDCLSLVEKYQGKLIGPLPQHRSEMFKSKVEMELQRTPGFLTCNTKDAIFEYMEMLERRIDFNEVNHVRSNSHLPDLK